MPRYYKFKSISLQRRVGCDPELKISGIAVVARRRIVTAHLLRRSPDRALEQVADLILHDPVGGQPHRIAQASSFEELVYLRVGEARIAAEMKALHPAPLAGNPDVVALDPDTVDVFATWVAGTPSITAQHAAMWSGAGNRGSGTATQNSAIRRVQRGAKLQPCARRAFKQLVNEAAKENGQPSNSWLTSCNTSSGAPNRKLRRARSAWRTKRSSSS